MQRLTKKFTETDKLKSLLELKMDELELENTRLEKKMAAGEKIILEAQKVL